MRFLAVCLALIALSVIPVLAQSVPASHPSMTITSGGGDYRSPHEVVVDGVQPGSRQMLVLFDPDGQQTIFQAQTAVTGHATWTLNPPNGQWILGLYRLVLPLGEGRAISETFVSGDHQAHLFAEPFLPSPTSVFDFVGIGLTPDTSVTLDLVLTAGQGEHLLQTVTDASGSFSLFVWPQQFGLPFFAAGDYLVQVSTIKPGTEFRVREHPGSSSLSVDGPVVKGLDATLHLRGYQADRLVWGMYAGLHGDASGEFLVGPTSGAGSLDTSVALTLPGPGQYLIGSPIDWGETSFEAIEPTATATATPPPTPAVTPSAIAPTPTATAPSRLRRARALFAPHGPRSLGPSPGQLFRQDTS
ncbi:MAG: hypothetical protein DLM70_08625 [Chloroflexi bacterium]|nr:MAG: hypothetical protein DLM70_08625 [Chloroflexota bacterium]